MVVIWSNVLSADVENISLIQFWKGVDIWIQRPHIINRKIVGVEIFELWTVVLKYSRDETIDFILKLTENFIDISNLKKQLIPVFKTANVIHDSPTDKDNCPGVLLQFRRLLPKHPFLAPVVEVALIDKTNGYVIFVPSKDVCESTFAVSFSYMLHFSELSKFALSINQPNAEFQNDSIAWLKTKVAPKIIRWCSCEMEKPEIHSLCQVPIKTFSENYSSLKAKYGKKLVESWSESTDPQKFVYEDIGIAAYLTTLWSEERKSLNSEEKQSFVDLGCGNGLLVHILSSEGSFQKYPGVGIDVRKRGIWNTYGPETNLLEKTIIPSDSVLFPEYDWIIGNHSDELTPWIPVIAARSSYKMRVFLLPCCPYSFNGKFNRANSNHTRYQSYLDFIEEVCKVMGFNVHRDKLRIPSTKRICFICQSRNYEYSSEQDINLHRTAFIHKYSNEDKHVQNTQTDIHMQNGKTCFVSKTDAVDVNAWDIKFKPKEKKETVRNCSTLDPLFIESTIKLVFNMLLKNVNFVELNYKESKILWNCGGTHHIKDIATELGSEILQKLKSQCGGLQTLLRIHQHIFTEEKGYISLSVPSMAATVSRRRNRKKMKNRKVEESKPLLKFRTKPCFFYFNHPQSCPLINECKFSHENNK